MGLLFFLVLGAGATLLGGGWILAARQPGETAMGRAFAFRSGILVAVALAHLLPEAWSARPAIAVWGALTAFAAFVAAEILTTGDPCREDKCRTHPIGAAALTGLSLHSLLDGANLAVAFAAGGGTGAAVGLAMTIHKLADGFTLASVMRQAGHAARANKAALAAVALSTPLGAALAAAGMAAVPLGVEAFALAFAAGSFLYLAGSDSSARLHMTRDVGALACFAGGAGAIVLLSGIRG